MSRYAIAFAAEIVYAPPELLSMTTANERGSASRVLVLRILTRNLVPPSSDFHPEGTSRHSYDYNVPVEWCYDWEYHEEQAGFGASSALEELRYRTPYRTQKY